MEKKYKVVGGLLAILAALTLVPYPGGKMAPTGYPALCSFAPFSTLILLIPAAAVFLTGRSKAGKRRKEELGKKGR